MSQTFAEFAASVASTVALAFFFLFDRSKGWAIGWTKFKADFIAYGWPIFKMVGAGIVIYAAVYALVFYWAIVWA
ncbi:hypothetical protein AB6864_26385 [Serratia proteamaculans]|jgi:hypothetical protein|uniref:hypothetical protein n=1 Tax=Serratia TaxID=613 RepID=UPI0010209C81|nr:MULTISPECIES: hypothetical protein [Serratia]RYM50734.1 hypothetical protein BSQ97_15355 [Serratia proteamaculans]CAI1656876.1 Uncharacterised protein [Serratia liquefaciens]HBL6730463.1 hypothetical protein [Serratia liquefaciens]